MPINIHGNQYVTVAERVTEAHTGLKEMDITTEVLYQNPVVIKATVKTPKGTFTGISAANPSKAIEKQSPYEVAETSAIGRALGFAGYGIVEGIATADEIVKAEKSSYAHNAPIRQENVSDMKCPKCGGDMWDNRKSKLNPRQPDYKCKDKTCDGVIWPPRDAFPHYDAEGNGLTEEQYQAYTQGEEIDIDDIQVEVDKPKYAETIH